MAWRHLRQCNTHNIDYRTVFGTFSRWCKKGVFDRAYGATLRLWRRRRRAKYAAIDKSFVKCIYGKQCVGRSPVDRGRKATKLSIIVDDVGIVRCMEFFPGNTSDYRTVEETIQSSFAPLWKGCALYADKGYDSQAVRQIIRRAGFVDRVEKRRKQTHRIRARKRRIVENTFAWLDKCRRLLVRYDAKIENYRAFTVLGCYRILTNRLF